MTYFLAIEEAFLLDMGMWPKLIKFFLHSALCILTFCILEKKYSSEKILLNAYFSVIKKFFLFYNFQFFQTFFLFLNSRDSLYVGKNLRQ